MTRSVENWLLSIAHELCRRRSRARVGEAFEEPERVDFWLDLTCAEAERAISLTLDGRLSRAELGLLMAHLHRCAACAGRARTQYAQRAALRSLADGPIPRSLASFSSGSNRP